MSAFQKIVKDTTRELYSDALDDQVKFQCDARLRLR